MDSAITGALNAAFPGSGSLISSVSNLFGGGHDEGPSAAQVTRQLQPLQPDDRLKVMYGIILSKPDTWNGKDSKAARFNQYIELFGKSTEGMTLDTVNKWNALASKYGEPKDILDTTGLSNSIGNVSNVTKVLSNMFGNSNDGINSGVVGAKSNLFGSKITYDTGATSWKPSVIFYGLVAAVLGVLGYFGFRKKKGWFRK